MLIYDIETDGLLDDLTCIHCICIYDTETDQTVVYNDQGDKDPVVRGVQYLEGADVIVGHNIVGFDNPAIRKCFPWFSPSGVCVDTLILSRVFHPNILEIDKKKKWRHMPLQLYGRHSLEAYGYRLGEYKHDFGKTTDWKEWSPEMQHYMEQDVEVTKKLCNHFQPYLTT